MQLYLENKANMWYNMTVYLGEVRKYMTNNIGNKNVPNNILTGAALLTGFISSAALASKIYKKISERNSKNELSFKEMTTSLEDEIKRSSKVFIVGHNNPDLDSIGSAIGLQHYATSCGKKAYIIVDDDQSKIESGAKKVIDDNWMEYRIIDKKTFQKLLDKNSLLIMTDVNKSSMISVGDCLDVFKSIFIIDHHSTNENTVQAKHIYISEKDSSSSEIVSKLLFSKKIKLRKEVATALLAGISLDTKRFSQKTSSSTFDVAKKLCSKDADTEYVNKLFLQDIDTRHRINELFLNGTVIYRLTDPSSLSPINVSFTLNRNNPLREYAKEDYAKLADEMLDVAGIDASFVLGYVESGLVKISARGNKLVDVSKVMNAMNGGGKPHSAAATINSDNIFDVEKDLLKKVKLGISPEEELLDEPEAVKVIQLKYPN